MGWDVYDRPVGLTDAAHLRDELLEPGNDWIAHGSGRGFDGERVFYGAARIDGSVMAVVVLQHGGGRRYSRKVIDENMGPAEDEAPANVLAVLDPTDNIYATDWRNRCRARLQATA